MTRTVQLKTRKDDDIPCSGLILEPKAVSITALHGKKEFFSSVHGSEYAIVVHGLSERELNG